MLEPRYNVGPTPQVLAVRANLEGGEGVLLRWGLVPSWASGPTTKVRMLSARGQTVREKPALRTAFLRTACGFYEWRVSGKKKLPVHFRMRDGRVVNFAGSWERWTSPDGEPPASNASWFVQELAVMAGPRPLSCALEVVG